LNLEQLLTIPSVDMEGGFDISPDGKYAAFSWNPSGQPELYLLPLDGSTPPQQITHGPGGKFAPRFSPQGNRLAYAVDLDGSEAFDIWVCDLWQGSHWQRGLRYLGLRPLAGQPLEPDPRHP